MSERLYQEYEAFSKRDLSGFDVVFLFVDGVYEAVKKYTNGQALLCAGAICSDGTKHFLHLAAVQSESQEAWEAFFVEMQRLGIKTPTAGDWRWRGWGCGCGGHPIEVPESGSTTMHRT